MLVSPGFHHPFFGCQFPETETGELSLVPKAVDVDGAGRCRGPHMRTGMVSRVSCTAATSAVASSVQKKLIAGVATQAMEATP